MSADPTRRGCMEIQDSELAEAIRLANDELLVMGSNYAWSYVFGIRNWRGDLQWIKIGGTTDIVRRLREIQTAMPFPLEFVARRPIPDVRMDSIIHRVMPKDDRIRGEWFDVTSEIMDRLKRLHFNFAHQQEAQGCNNAPPANRQGNPLTVDDAGLAKGTSGGSLRDLDGRTEQSAPGSSQTGT